MELLKKPESDRSRTLRHRRTNNVRGVMKNCRVILSLYLKGYVSQLVRQSDGPISRYHRGVFGIARMDCKTQAFYKQYRGQGRDIV